jgi:hypothetical protein
MKLLTLHPARLSLEFSPEELPLVRSRLTLAARRGRIPARLVQREGAAHQMISVRGIDFILMTDLGEWALISTNAQGDGILRNVIRQANRGGVRARRRQLRGKSAESALAA